MKTIGPDGPWVAKMPKEDSATAGAPFLPTYSRDSQSEEGQPAPVI